MNRAFPLKIIGPVPCIRFQTSLLKGWPAGNPAIGVIELRRQPGWPAALHTTSFEAFGILASDVLALAKRVSREAIALDPGARPVIVLPEGRAGQPFSAAPMRQITPPLAGTAILVALTLVTRVAAAQESCLAAPSGAAPEGQHWYYRTNQATQSKCWHLGADVKPASAGSENSARESRTATAATRVSSSPPPAERGGPNASSGFNQERVGPQRHPSQPNSSQTARAEVTDVPIPKPAPRRGAQLQTRQPEDAVATGLGVLEAGTGADENIVASPKPDLAAAPELNSATPPPAGVPLPWPTPALDRVNGSASAAAAASTALKTDQSRAGPNPEQTESPQRAVESQQRTELRPNEKPTPVQDGIEQNSRSIGSRQALPSVVSQSIRARVYYVLEKITSVASVNVISAAALWALLFGVILAVAAVNQLTKRIARLVELNGSSAKLTSQRRN